MYYKGVSGAARRAKLFLLRLARASGVNALVLRSRFRQSRLLILAYHGTSIDDEHLWSPDLYITQDALRRRLQLLEAARCTVLPLGEAVRALYHDELPPRSVVITVDDGTYDFHARAYPVYAQAGMPVTVYLTTYYSLFNRPVYDAMASYLLWKARERSLCWPEVLGSSGAVALSGPMLRAAQEKLREYARTRRLSGAGKDALLRQLAERLEVDYEPILQRRILQLMNPDEVRTLAAAGVDFQLHTHRHGVSMDPGIFAEEIRANRECIRQSGGGEAAHFCYPSGYYRNEFPEWLRKWGVVSATTCEPGLASTQSDAMLLPRLLDGGGVSEEEFVGWVSGLAALLPSRRSHAHGRLLVRDPLRPGKLSVELAQ